MSPLLHICAMFSTASPPPQRSPPLFPEAGSHRGLIFRLDRFDLTLLHEVKLRMDCYCSIGTSKGHLGSCWRIKIISFQTNKQQQKKKKKNQEEEINLWEKLVPFFRCQHCNPKIINISFPSHTGVQLTKGLFCINTYITDLKNFDELCEQWLTYQCDTEIKNV